MVITQPDHRSKKKTDRRDAENRQLTAMRQVLTKKRPAVLNSLHKVLRKYNVEQDCPTKLIQTKKVREWLATVYLPEIDRLEEG